MEPLAVKGAVFLWNEIGGQIKYWTEHIRREPIKIHGQPSISAVSRSKHAANRAYPSPTDHIACQPSISHANRAYRVSTEHMPCPTEHIRRRPIIRRSQPSISTAVNQPIILKQKKTATPRPSHKQTIYSQHCNRAKNNGHHPAAKNGD